MDEQKRHRQRAVEITRDELGLHIMGLLQLCVRLNHALFTLSHLTSPSFVKSLIQRRTRLTSTRDDGKNGSFDVSGS